MDLRNNAMLAWGVAGVLALILIIMLIVNAARGPVNWNDIRDTIVEQCRGTDPGSVEDCRRSLELLEETLIDVDRELTEARQGATATTTEAVPEAAAPAP